MSSSLLTPDLRRILDDLARRLGILERRTVRTAPPAGPLPNHTHNGTGADSTIVGDTANPAVASGPESFAAGAGAVASGQYSTMVGPYGTASAQFATALGDSASASATEGTAVGPNTVASAAEATAVGNAAHATHSDATAVGNGAATTSTHQIMLGTPSATTATRTVQGAPNGAIASADLGRCQISFYLDESGNNLVVKAKYSDNTTVKTGTIALT